MNVTLSALYDVIDGTWPAKRRFDDGPWRFREGDGGGKRVSATSALSEVGEADIDAAEIVMRDMGQERLFMLRAGDDALDARLSARGYALVDPVKVYACDTALLTDVAIPRVTIFTIWEPLAIMAEIWAQGGVGPARLRVMDRAAGPKTALLCRMDEKPGGVAFVAMQDNVAMVHAVETLPRQRRKGVARWIMRGAAFWAAEQGADTLAVICTDANEAANALYASLGFGVVGHYHYRVKPEKTS